MPKSIHVYIIPLSENQLNNKLFDKSSDGSHSIWSYVKDYLENNNIQINTIDFFNKNNHCDNNVVIVLNHPSQSLPRRIIYKLRKVIFKLSYFNIKYDNFDYLLKKFNCRILFHFEPPVVTPQVYNYLEYIKYLYDEIYLTCQVDNFGYFHMPQTFDFPIEPYFNNNNRNKKKLILMNSNKKPLIRKNELYGERLKAIRFFSRYGEIDLYGDLWDRLIFFPYTFYKKYVKRSYRGFVEDKIVVMSQYQFAICFENEISPGWITEKIFDCFLAGTIPIYYGAPNITDYIPADCFIDFRKFKDYKELRNYLFMLTNEDIDEYKKNILNYYKSGRFMQFSKEGFADKILHSIINK